MNNLDRKEFLKKMAILAVSAAFLPKSLFGSAAKRVSPLRLLPLPALADFKRNDNAIIDLHCHPSLKMYLWDKRFWKRHWLRSPGENIFHQQEDTHEFEYGNVQGMVSTHYLVEKDIESRWALVKFLWPFLNTLWFSEANKIEHDDYSNFTQINVMIDTLESQVYVANKKRHVVDFVIARNFEEFEEALRDPKKIPMAHGIEGAHALGRNFARSKGRRKKKLTAVAQSPQLLTGKTVEESAILPGEGKMVKPGTAHPEEKYIRNLEALFARGVCMMTLSHFFENDISFPVEGISPNGKQFPGFTWHYDNRYDNIGLTKVGVAVVHRMLEIGMIVDLTHSTPQVRQDVFGLRDEVNTARRGEKIPKYARPVVFSHVGSQEVFNRHDNGKYPGYSFYDISKDEVVQLCVDGGVIGVIPEIFFLAGSDEVPEIANQTILDYDLGIPYLIETIKELNSYTPGKNYDNIAIGTDFDGLADNPKDLYLNRQLSGLIQAMQSDEELKKDDRIAKITHLNALNLLKYGWGERRAANL